MANYYGHFLQRHGTYAELTEVIEQNNGVFPDEIVIVDSGDPNTQNGTAVYFKPASGELERLAKSDEIGETAEAVAVEVPDEIAEMWDEAKGSYAAEKGALVNVYSELYWLANIVEHEGSLFYDWIKAVDEANISDYISGKENTTNKVSSITDDNKSSTVLYPSVKAAADYVDSMIASISVPNVYSDIKMPPWLVPNSSSYSGSLKVGDMWQYRDRNLSILKTFVLTNIKIESNRVYFEWACLYPKIATDSFNDPPSQEVLSLTSYSAISQIGIDQAFPRSSYLKGDFYIRTGSGSPLYNCICFGFSGSLSGNTYTLNMYWSKSPTTDTAYTKSEIDSMIGG